MSNEAFTHVEDFIDDISYNRKEDLGINYAKFFFEITAMKAWKVMNYKPFMENHKLFCTFQNKRYRVTGSSAMGDIWLHSNFNVDEGYQHRVSLDECSQWGYGFTNFFNENGDVEFFDPIRLSSEGIAVRTGTLLTPDQIRYKYITG